MAYWTNYLMVSDQDLKQRLYACAAEQSKGVPDSVAWVNERLWAIVAAPGWSAKWESAIVSSVPNLGRSESVISDGDILAVIAALQ